MENHGGDSKDFKNLDEWGELYEEDGIKVDFSHLLLPKRRKGFDRLIFIPEGLKIQQACDNLRFPVGTDFENRNLDEVVIKNDRDSAKGAYAIRVRNRVNADEEMKNPSANDLLRRRISGITLLERIQYERKHFKETGGRGFLDYDVTNLCPGSRIAGGYVPGVHGGGGWGGINIWLFGVDFSDDSLRPRVVVA